VIMEEVEALRQARESTTGLSAADGHASQVEARPVSARVYYI
jgi:hypothetical protein